MYTFNCSVSYYIFIHWTLTSTRWFSDSYIVLSSKDTICLIPGRRNMNYRLDGWMDGWMGGWMDGWVDGWMGGWMDGWVGGWMDGSM